MARKKNKKKNDEYLINTIEYSTWENEFTLSRTFGDVVSAYIRTKCLPAVETTSSQYVVSDVTFMRNDESPDDVEVDVVDVQPTNTPTTQELLSTHIQSTTTQESLTSTEIENCATPPVTVNMCWVENAFQLNPGASMIVKSRNIVHPKIIHPSGSATKPTVKKSFNPSISTECLNRLKSLFKSQETVPTKEKTASSSEQKISRKLQEKPHVCNVCDYKSSKKSHLKEHMQRHTGEKPFSCDVCDYKSSKKSNLKEHMQRHKGDKPFSCDVCDYKSSKKSHLKEHMQRHKGDKPHVCNECGYKCSHKGDLTKHMRTHTGEKRHACNVCGYKCSSKSNLKQHIRTHTGEKPFVCDVCEYKSSMKSHLTRHIRTHAGEKSFSQ